MPTVIFPGRYDSLAKIAELVQQAAQELGLDSCAAYSAETAVDEACSNIIEHAYGGEDKGIIEFTYLTENNQLTVILRDHGKKFNPSKARKPNLSASLKDRPSHGLGLYFMQQWMDEVRFEYVDGHNVLTMIKRGGGKP